MLPKIAIMLIGLLLFGLRADAQNIPVQPNVAANNPGTILLPLQPAEQQVLLQMCDAAKWANRMVFADACDQLKAKMEEVRRSSGVKPPG